MKKLVLFLFFVAFSYACEGDCVACHTNIVKDGILTKGHEKLDSCKTCHTKEKMAEINMGSDSCGQDCWECHSMKKVVSSGVKEHETLATCKQCHNDVENSIFKKIKSQQGTLQDFLKK